MPHVVKVFAPATVSNIAVGFDILGFAIEGPGDDILIKPGDEPGLKITTITGAKSKIPYDIHQNTASFAALKFLQHIGAENEPIHMEIRKKMPIGSGLGSSAASAVAGVYGVNKYLKARYEKKDLLLFALQGERLISKDLPLDNVAPSLLGGMVLIRDNDTLDYKKLYIPEGLTAVIIYPHIQIITKESRALLPTQIPLDKYIKQTGNLASFVAAMYTGDFALLKRSLEDVIFEPERSKLIPNFNALKTIALEEGALGFSISGSGPAMFALCDNTFIAENIQEKSKAFLKENKIRNTIYISGIHHEGAFAY